MISIIDYKAGNLTSVERALKKLSIPCRITHDPDLILQSDRVIFPGVGAAGEAMKVLRTSGLGEAIKAYFRSGRPLLGICLGTQVILDFSQENETPCLGILPGEAVRFPDPHLDEKGKALKIPHMGWNRVEWNRRHPLIKGLPLQSTFYFVHSYFPVPGKKVLSWAGLPMDFLSLRPWLTGMLAALQFHPEKSGPPGLALLQAFSEWEGEDAD